MDTTPFLFTIANTAILFAWLPLLVAPKKKIAQTLIAFPYVPLVISLFYLYFLLTDGDLSEADFSSLEGILKLYHQATPEATAAGWMHYLAFDYWVGCWVLRDAQKRELPHALILLPLLSTFMLGPVGLLLYVIFSQLYLTRKA